jgi:hypothetical protein
VVVTEKPGPMALTIEATPFTIKTEGGAVKAEKMVEYSDNTVDLRVVARGQPGQKLELKMTLNDVDKELKVKLYRSGLNEYERTYPYTDFFPSST